MSRVNRHFHRATPSTDVSFYHKKFVCTHTYIYFFYIYKHICKKKKGDRYIFTMAARNCVRVKFARRHFCIVIISRELSGKRRLLITRRAMVRYCSANAFWSVHISRTPAVITIDLTDVSNVIPLAHPRWQRNLIRTFPTYRPVLVPARKCIGKPSRCEGKPQEDRRSLLNNVFPSTSKFRNSVSLTYVRFISRSDRAGEGGQSVSRLMNSDRFDLFFPRRYLWIISGRLEHWISLSRIRGNQTVQRTDYK